MTIDNWLMIAVILSTLIAPTIAEFLKPRINQPKATPEPSQPKNLTQKIGGWFIFVSQSPWLLPPSLILFNICLLTLELRKTSPVTRWTVYQIAADVAGLWYGITLFLLNTIWQAIRRQDATAILQSDTDLKLLDLITALGDNFNEVSKKSLALTDRTLTALEESKRGKLSRLWASIKHKLAD